MSHRTSTPAIPNFSAISRPPIVFLHVTNVSVIILYGLILVHALLAELNLNTANDSNTIHNEMVSCLSSRWMSKQNVSLECFPLDTKHFDSDTLPSDSFSHRVKHVFGCLHKGLFAQYSSWDSRGHTCDSLLEETYEFHAIL